MKQRRGPPSVHCASAEETECVLREMRYVSDDEDDSGDVDFSAAVLYLAAGQVVVAVLGSAFATVCLPMISANLMPSAVRTLLFATIFGILPVVFPIRIGRARGMNLVFQSLRPAVPIYLLSTVLDQLRAVRNSDHTWRRSGAAGHLIWVVILGASLVRARWPRGERDAWLLVVVSALVVAALLPPQLSNEPLSRAVSGWIEALDRCGRAVLFSLLYCTAIFSAPPRSIRVGEIAVASMRAGAAGIWVLAANAWLLVFVAVQIGTVLFFSQRTSQKRHYDVVDDRSDGVCDDVTNEGAETGGISDAELAFLAGGKLLV